MSSRAAAKKVAPAKSAPAKTAKAKPASKPAAKPAKAAPARKPAPAAKVKAPAKAAKPAARPAPKPAPVQKPAPLVVHKSPPMAAQRPAPQVAPRPAPAPRPPVVAAVLSPPKAPPRPPGVPVAAPPKPQPKPQPTLARSYFFTDLREGDDLPPLAKPPVDRVQIARYAVEAHELNRLHLDEPYAAALGYRTTFAPGAMAMGFVAQMVSQWLRRGLVRKLQARFVKIVRPGDELTCRGRVAELRREKTACLAELELWAENQKGELVLRGHATCELLESPASIPGEGGLLSGVPRPLVARGQPPPRKPAPRPKKK
jgi:acyl dehydratase